MREWGGADLDCVGAFQLLYRQPKLREEKRRDSPATYPATQATFPCTHYHYGRIRNASDDATLLYESMLDLSRPRRLGGNSRQARQASAGSPLRQLLDGPLFGFVVVWVNWGHGSGAIQSLM